MLQIVRLLLLACIITFIGLQNAWAKTVFAEKKEVKQYIHFLVKRHHFNEQVLTKLFNQIKIRPRIIENFNRPLEKKPWYQYQELFVNKKHINEGLLFWRVHARTLQAVEKKYGVPASIIVATIGIETRYGRHMGDFRVLDSLANLAFAQTSRAKFFRHELTEFLLLCREKQLSPLHIMGSYAGAIGVGQFLPSSYRRFAVSFNHHKKIDLSHNFDDAIASVANYYFRHGWQNRAPVAIGTFAFNHPFDILFHQEKLPSTLSVRDAMRLGLTPKETLPLALKVKIIELQNRYHKEYWLTFNNFAVIKRYNSSDLYAMAVYQLSTKLQSQQASHHG